MNMIRDIDIRNEISHIFTGSVVLVLRWTLVSLVHEFFHSLTAALLGYQVSFNEIALNSGSDHKRGNDPHTHGSRSYEWIHRTHNIWTCTHISFRIPNPSHGRRDLLKPRMDRLTPIV